MHRIALALICLAVAACGQTRTATVPEAAVAPAAQDEAVEEASLSAEAAVVPPPVPSEKPTVPTVALDELVGLDEDMVVAMIGEPHLRENRAPATAWIYDQGSCRFGLLIYPDLESDRRLVLSYETEDDRTCPARRVAQ